MNRSEFKRKIDEAWNSVRSGLKVAESSATFREIVKELGL